MMDSLKDLKALCLWNLTWSFRVNLILRCHARKMVKLLQSLPIDGLEAFLYEPWLHSATAVLILENLSAWLQLLQNIVRIRVVVLKCFEWWGWDRRWDRRWEFCCFWMLRIELILRSVKRVDMAELPPLVTELCCGPWSDPICRKLIRRS